MELDELMDKKMQDPEFKEEWDKQWISVKEAAKIMNLSDNALRRYIKTGDLISRKEKNNTGHYSVIERESFDKFRAIYNMKFNTNQYTKPEQANLIDMLNFTTAVLGRIENLLIKQQETNEQILTVFKGHTALLHESTHSDEDVNLRSLMSEILVSNPEAYVPFKDLYEAYAEEVENPIDSNNFSQALTKIGLQTTRKKVEGKKLTVLKGYELSI